MVYALIPFLIIIITIFFLAKFHRKVVDEKYEILNKKLQGDNLKIVKSIKIDKEISSGLKTYIFGSQNADIYLTDRYLMIIMLKNFIQFPVFSVTLFTNRDESSWAQSDFEVFKITSVAFNENVNRIDIFGDDTKYYDRKIEISIHMSSKQQLKNFEHIKSCL